jgi:hypothetical protein
MIYQAPNNRQTSSIPERNGKFNVTNISAIGLSEGVGSPMLDGEDLNIM